MDDDLDDGGSLDLDEIEFPTPEQRAFRKKVLAVIVAVAVVLASFGVWYFVFRHWSIHEFETRIVGTQWSPGFDPSLAGTSVFVQGRVTEIETHNTTLGPLTLIELDDFGYIHVIEWKEPSVEVGDILVKEIHFEWSRFNDDIRVFSPQLDFPVFPPAYSIPVVLESVSLITGMCLVPRADNSSSAMIIEIILPRGEAFPLGMFNASLRKGALSWTAEYIDTMDGYESNQELEFLESLEDGVGSNGNMNFIDSNQNGLFDEEDYFEVYLDRPEEESAVLTYLLLINGKSRYIGFNILEGMCYIVMTNRGLLRVTVVQDPSSTAFDFGSLEISSEYIGIRGITTELVVAKLWSPPLPLESSGCKLVQHHWVLECDTLRDGEVASEGNISISFEDSNDDGFLNPGDVFVVTGLANWTEYKLNVILSHGEIFSIAWTTGIGRMTGNLPVIDWELPLAVDPPINHAFKLQIKRMYGVYGVKFGEPYEFFTVDVRMNGSLVFSSDNLTKDFNYTSAELNITFEDADGNGFVNAGDFFICKSSGPGEVEIVLGYVHFMQDDYQHLISWPISWQTG
jgi:hypothetical protein